MNKGKSIGCEEALKNLFLYLDEELEKKKHRAVEHHLTICRSCFSRADFEKKLQTGLLNAGEEPVRPSLEKKIKALLKRY